MGQASSDVLSHASGFSLECVFASCNCDRRLRRKHREMFDKHDADSLPDYVDYFGVSIVED